MNLPKKSFRFLSPTKHIPTESFFEDTGKFIFLAIFLTSVLRRFSSGKMHFSNSFSLTSWRKYV